MYEIMHNMEKMNRDMFSSISQNNRTEDNPWNWLEEHFKKTKELCTAHLWNSLSGMVKAMTLDLFKRTTAVHGGQDYCFSRLKNIISGLVAECLQMSTRREQWGGGGKCQLCLLSECCCHLQWLLSTLWKRLIEKCALVSIPKHFLLSKLSYS